VKHLGIDDGIIEAVLSQCCLDLDRGVSAAEFARAQQELLRTRSTRTESIYKIEIDHASHGGVGPL
jgi:hypothetical protein